MSQKTILLLLLGATVYAAYYFFGTMNELRSKKAPKPDIQGG